tara:strand:+ start:930 stop:2054 length:1125 start_codon:yes stop_codon:yes gene_type:complete
MKNKILIRISIIVSVQPRFVVVDGPNVHTDRYCLQHNRRQCTKCKIKFGWKMEKGFDRSLDVDKLKIVADRLLEYGYEPRISIFDTTYHNLRTNRKKNEDFGTKWKILRKLTNKGKIIVLDKEKWLRDDKVIDDIWYLDIALQIDAIILTNDNFKDWKKDRPDIDWEKVENSRIRFLFTPEEIDMGEPQVFAVPELPKLTDLPPEKLIEMRESERRKLLDKAAAIDSEINELKSKQLVISSQAKTSESEIGEGHDFLGHEEEIISAWLELIELGGGTTGAFASTLWRNVAGAVLGLDYSDHGVLARNDKFDTNLAKEKMGFSPEEEPIRILEHQMTLLEEHTGMQIKFSPDQSSVGFVDHHKWEEKKKQMGEEE